MSDLREHPRTLPKSLRADRVVKTPLACRFGWHHILWDAVNPERYWKQTGTCTKCGVAKSRLV